MAAVVTQKNRLLTISINGMADNTLLLGSFSGCEKVSSLFSFNLRLLSQKSAQVVPSTLLGKNATIGLQLRDGSYRFFNGYFSRFTQGMTELRFATYHAELVPWLWFLARTWDCRIFQDMTVPDIVKKVFADFGFLDFRFALTKAYTKVDYCVQYRESDFAFVSRLLEEEGIFYFFEHSQGKHVLVLGDSPQSHPPCADQPQALFDPTGDAGIDQDVVTRWQETQEVRPGKYTLRDYHFEMPKKTFEVTRPSTLNGQANPKLEIYDYPGAYALRFNKTGQRLGDVQPEADRFVKLRMEEEETPHVLVSGSSICRGFAAGTNFKLLQPPQGSSAGPYVLTSLQHSATQGSLFSGDDQASYANSFTCIPQQLPFRPARLTPKPVMQGPQTAQVVGFPGKEISVDKYGRVKVQFHWDREGQMNQDSSCWVRVAQIWAGKRWGASFWPRVGQEVIVDFLEGDPDQPIVIGSVYNANQPPPYLGDGLDPKHKDDPNVSGIKSCSTPGGDGFNEIRFDDTKGKEQLFLHAQGSMDVAVNGDQKTTVGKDCHLKIGGGYRELVESYKDVEVIGPMQTRTAGNYGLRVHGEFAHFTAGRYKAISNDAFLIGGSSLVLVVSESQLILRCGGSFITIDDGEIIIQSPNVSINPGAGAPIVPEAPTGRSTQTPVGADDSKSGFPSNT